MTSRPSPQAVAAGLIAAFVGFGGAFTVVVSGLTAAGASPAEAASGLMAVTVAMGLSGIILSLRFRMPISVAWSTPGAALLAALLAVTLWRRAQVKRALAEVEARQGRSDA